MFGFIFQKIKFICKILISSLRIYITVEQKTSAENYLGYMQLSQIRCNLDQVQSFLILANNTIYCKQLPLYLYITIWLEGKSSFFPSLSAFFSLSCSVLVLLQERPRTIFVITMSTITSSNTTTTNDKGNFLTRSHSIHLVGVAESESKLHLAVSLLCIVQYYRPRQKTVTTPFLGHVYKLDKERLHCKNIFHLDIHP